MEDVYIYKLSDLGMLIAKERQKAGYTQEQFAELIGASHATISKLENGNSVNSKLLERALQILGKQIIVKSKGC